MSDLPPTQLITTGVRQLLIDHLGGTSPHVYDTVVPVDAQFPYWVVYQIPGGEGYGPPLTDPDADTQIVVQVDSVAGRRDQAQLNRDRAANVMLSRRGGALQYDMGAIAGWAFCGRMRNDVPGGVEVEGAPPNAVFTASDRYTIAVTPTASS